MIWVLLGIAVLAAVAVVAAGRGTGLPPASTDRPAMRLPADRALRRGDVDDIRFSVGLRGYRMDEVDDVLDRLAAEIADRDERLAALERDGGPGPVAAPPPDPVPEQGADLPEQVPEPAHHQRALLVPLGEEAGLVAAQEGPDGDPDA